MGEFGAVLNGVPFWTRHNDYKLAQPVQEGGSKFYNKLQDVEQPDVPPSVLAKRTVAEQVEEMRMYFKVHLPLVFRLCEVLILQAWQEQDTNIRNYKPYFPAALCVLEGAWIKHAANIDEPFASDRYVAIDVVYFNSL